MQPSSPAGRTPAQAVQAYVDLVQLQLTCVSSAVVDVRGGYHMRELPHLLAVANGDTVTLRGPARVMIQAAQSYLIIDDNIPRTRYSVRVTGYYYTIIDHSHREIVAFHWHPNSESRVLTPHLHLGAGSLVGREELQRSHLPTGFVELQQVLRLLIEEFQVTPLRADWDALLR